MKGLPVRYPACFWAARDHFRTSSLVHHRCWFSYHPVSGYWDGSKQKQPGPCLEETNSKISGAVITNLWSYEWAAIEKPMHGPALRCRVCTAGVYSWAKEQESLSHAHLSRHYLFIFWRPRIIPQMRAGNKLNNVSGRPLPLTIFIADKFTSVAPFSAVVSTPGTRRPMLTSKPELYFSLGTVWVCCQMKSSRCKPCALTPGPMSKVAADERIGSVLSFMELGSW